MPQAAAKVEAAYRDYVRSTEPQCQAHRAYAAEDARDLAQLAVATHAFLERAISKLKSADSVLGPGADFALMSACVVEQLQEVMTPKAAKLFAAEFASMQVS